MPIILPARFAVGLDGNDGCFAGGYGRMVCAEQHARAVDIATDLQWTRTPN
jgi:hypothetical protein